MVARAALAEGLDRLSMPGVARRLGVSHAALYTYVADRDDLVLAAADLAVAEHSWPDPGQEWRPLLESLADALWDLLAAYPGTARAVQTMRGAPPGVVGLLHRYAARLVECGFTRRDALVALDFVADLAVATSAGMAALDGPAGAATRRDAYRAAFAGLPELTDQATLTGRGWLDDKIAIFLDGLALRRSDRADTLGRG